MGRQPLFHPLDLDGSPIDASFIVEDAGQGFAICFASRGGTKGTPAARNIEYHVGLKVLLDRLKALDAVVSDILLDSQAARRQPVTERRLSLVEKFRFPVALIHVENTVEFRRAISDAQKDVLTAPGRDAKHGNRMRSIRLFFRLPTSHASMGVPEITQFLVGADTVGSTADPIELKQRVSRIRARGPVPRPKGNPLPMPVEGPVARRYSRLPSVAAYVLQRASGRCELCSQTPFVTESGEAYLEVHHVVQLARGGPDIPENTVALCPNCHRELHHGANRNVRVALLYDRVPELMRITEDTHFGCL